MGDPLLSGSLLPRAVKVWWWRRGFFRRLAPGGAAADSLLVGRGPPEEAAVDDRPFREPSAEEEAEEDGLLSPSRFEPDGGTKIENDPRGDRRIKLTQSKHFAGGMMPWK